MNNLKEIKVLVIGSVIENTIKSIFDIKIAQESKNPMLNTTSRILRIKELKSQVVGFIKRNPNSIFELVIPEHGLNKNLSLQFTNFQSFDPEDEYMSKYQITVNEDFVSAKIIQRVAVGEDIVLKIKAQ